MKDLIEKTIGEIEPLDENVMAQAQERLDNLTKPQGSLGTLEHLAKQIAGIMRNPKPSLIGKTIFTFAGDHGVTEEGISAYPSEVTAQMVLNFLKGGAAINVLAKHIGARVLVVDMGVASDIKNQIPDSKTFKDKKIAFGTKNMTRGPAMSREEAERSICAGIEVLQSEKDNTDIIGIGDMGIGNTTSSSAIVAVITGEEATNVTGRGTGIDDVTLRKKIEAIQKAVSLNKPDPEDPIDVLAKVGGLEIAGAAGCILAGAAANKPVVINGFISSAAALIASELAPAVKPYLIASHLSVEAGHRAMLKRMGLRPLFDLDMRLGEGTGASLGIFICEASIRILTQMATFEEADVSHEK